MAIRTILVQLDFFEFPTSRVKLAVALAERFDAGLIGFAARQIPAILLSDGSGLVVQKEHTEIEKGLAELQRRFRAAVPKARFVDWRAFVDAPVWSLASEARAADLILTGSPKANDGAASIDLGGLVISAGRPVLIAADGTESLSADSALVAWKDTREARRAVRDALPFLSGAKQVVVATVDDVDVAAGRAGAEDVVAFLSRHGVKARAELGGKAGQPVGDRLVAMAEQIGADLIVSGGYGHSRLREWAFGGVTRSLLGHGTINRLMSS